MGRAKIETNTLSNLSMSRNLQSQKKEKMMEASPLERPASGSAEHKQWPQGSSLPLSSKQDLLNQGPYPLRLLLLPCEKGEAGISSSHPNCLLCPSPPLGGGHLPTQGLLLKLLLEYPGGCDFANSCSLPPAGGAASPFREEAKTQRLQWALISVWEKGAPSMVAGQANWAEKPAPRPLS